MNQSIIIFVVFASAIPLNAQVTGSVRLLGNKPPAEIAWADGKPAPGFDEHLLVDNPLWRVDTKGGLECAVVSVRFKDGKLPAFQRPTEPAILALRDNEFEPHVVGMVVGQPLQLLNRDAIGFYNIHADRTRSSAIGKIVHPDLPVDIYSISKEENLLFYCSRRPWMSARVCCFFHPFFAVTKADGTFEISQHLPDGAYEFEAWHESGRTARKTVDVKNGKAVVDIEIQAPTPKPPTTKPVKGTGRVQITPGA